MHHPHYDLRLVASSDIEDHADVVANLWPQSFDTQPWNARMKDALENRLHALVCAGRLSLEQAQREIAADWIGAYGRHVGRRGGERRGSSRRRWPRLAARHPP
jgi:hypothetical protein